MAVLKANMQTVCVEVQVLRKITPTRLMVAKATMYASDLLLFCGPLCRVRPHMYIERGSP